MFSIHISFVVLFSWTGCVSILPEWWFLLWLYCTCRVTWSGSLKARLNSTLHVVLPVEKERRLSRWNTHTHKLKNTNTLHYASRTLQANLSTVSFPSQPAVGSLTARCLNLSLNSALSQKWMFSLSMFTLLDYQSCIALCNSL